MSAGEVHQPDLRIQLLGPVALIVDGKSVAIGGPGVRGLLALLALSANTVVTVEELIDTLWGHEPPNTARTILHGNVSHLRRVLRSVAGGTASDPAQILTRHPGYELVIDAERVDVHRAQALLDHAGTAHPARRGELLAEASALWNGQPLGGVPRSVCAPELEDLRISVHGARIDADLELGRHTELIPELTTMVRCNPLAERTVGQLMRALYYDGRRADALELFRRASHRAVRTLGIDLGPELRELHERVLQDDLIVPRQGQAIEPIDVGSVPLVQLPPGVADLKGRAAELEWLDEQCIEATSATAVIATVTGTAGVGKSALVISWARRVAREFPNGVLFATLRGFDPNHPAVQPNEVLAHFLLALGVREPDLPKRMEERVGLYRSLLADRKTLVILDDVRTAEQVRPLLPSGTHSMAVVTSRSRLDGLVVSNAARHMALDVLLPKDAVGVVKEFADPARGDSADYEELAELCGFLPLALRIAGARLTISPQWTVRDLIGELANERSRLVALEMVGSDTSVRAALDVSYRGLSVEVADTFLLLGALPVTSVRPHLIAAICGVDVAEARRRLRALHTHHLLIERGKDVFVAHDLTRLYLRALAESQLCPKEWDDVLVQGVRYYQVVADRARRRLLRIVDPLDFTSVLAGAIDQEFDDFASASDWFAAEWSNLLSVLEAARLAGHNTDVWQLARLVHTYRVVRPQQDEWARLAEIGTAAAVDSGSKLAECWMLISRCAASLTFDLAEESLADAKKATEIGASLEDEGLRISAAIHLGCALCLCSRYDEAIAHLHAAIAETERLGDPALRGQALANCAEAEKRAGRYSEAIEHQLRSLRIDRELGDDSYAVVSLNNLAELHLSIGDLTRAEQYANESIELSDSRGFTLQEGIARLILGRAFRAAGDLDSARNELETSLTLQTSVGSRLGKDIKAELDELAGFLTESGAHERAPSAPD